MTVGPVARDDATAAFFDGTARNELLLARCIAGHLSSPDASTCHQCGARIEDLHPASGRATLVSWSTVAPPRGAAPGTPSVIAVIAQLSEGPWWWSRLVVDGDRGQLQVGAAVRVEFERHDDGSEAVPVFRLL